VFFFFFLFQKSLFKTRLQGSKECTSGENSFFKKKIKD